MAKIIITAPHIVENDGRLLRQYKALNDAGFEVKFIAPETGDKQNPLVQYANWSRKSIELLTGFLPASLKRFFIHRIKNYFWTKALKNENADIIITSEPEGLIATHSLSNNKTAIIYDCHEFYDDETDDTARNEWAAKIHEKYIYKADALLTVSQGILDLYLKKYPSIKNHAIMMNVSPFKKNEYDGSLHDRLGIDRGKKLIVFHGNLRQDRGIERFPQIASLMSDDNIFVVIGNGALKEFIEKSTNNHLKYLSEIPYYEVEKYLCGASLGLILYVPRNLNQEWCAPNKLFELTNLNVPILTYKTKSMVEFAKDLPNLHLISPDSSDYEIAQTIDKILQKTPKKTTIPENYTMEFQGKSFLKIIFDTINNKANSI